MVLVIMAAVAVAGGSLALLITRGDSQDGQRNDPPTVALSADEHDYAEAIADSTSQDMVMADTMAQCIGAATVEMVGIDALRHAATVDQLRYSTVESLRDFGVTVGEPQVAELARRFDECGDWTDLLITSWAQAQATPETLDCLGDNFSEEQLAYLAAASFVGTRELSDSVERTSQETIQLCAPGTGGLGG
jgi:hypothetical protein